MSISDIAIKVVGLILVIVGLGLVLAAVGVNLIGVEPHFPWWVQFLLGLLLIGIGVYLIRGGSISP